MKVEKILKYESYLITIYIRYNTIKGKKIISVARFSLNTFNI